MEFTAAEQKRLDRWARFQGRVDRHPRIIQLVVWLVLVIPGLHVLDCALAVAAAVRVANGPEMNLANGFVPDLDKVSEEDRVWKVIESHGLLTDFWVAICRASVNLLAAVFFVSLFVWMRLTLRDSLLTVKLHRRVQELEAKEVTV